jgi:polysaccharide pyruvyl transferase WcaK-like protein
VPLRIAICGTFDVDNYGDHLFPRIATHELTRRIPGASVEPWSPYGWLHPTPLDDGCPASPLGPWTAGRAGAFARAYDGVLVGGGEIVHLNDPLLAPVYGTPPAELEALGPSRCFVENLGPQLERDCPVVWHAVGVPVETDPAQARRLAGALRERAYVAVRDHDSERRLRDAGVTGDISVVPDSGLLLQRVLPEALLRDRLEILRRRRCYPPGPTLVVQGCDLLVPHADRIAAALCERLDRSAEPTDVVLLETGRCRADGRFADALAERLGPRRTWRLPADAGVSDIAAAVWGGVGFAGSSLHGSITALVCGRPFVIVDPAHEPKLAGFAALAGVDDRLVRDPATLPEVLAAGLAARVPDRDVRALVARVDDHFDKVAEIVTARTGHGRDDGPSRDELERSALVDLLDLLRRAGAGSAPADAERRAALAEARLAVLATRRPTRRAYSVRAKRLYRRLRHRP